MTAGVGDFATRWAAAPERRRAAFLGLLTAVVCVAVNWRNYMVDFVPLALLPVTVVRDGTLALDAYRPYYEALPPEQRFPFLEVDGHLYSIKPVFVSLLSLPAFLPALAAAGPFPDQQAEVAFWVAWGRLPAAALTGLAVALAYLTAHRYGSPAAALGLTLALAFGTCYWTTVGQTLTYHAGGVLCVAALAYTLRDLPLPAGRAAWAGFLAGAAVALRLTPLALLLPLGLYLCLPGRVRGFRAWLAALAGVCAGPAALAIYNRVAFGGWLTTGYAPEMHKWTSPWLEGMVGQFFAPNSGLFVQAPWMLLAVAGGWAAWKDRAVPDRGLLAACALGFLAYAALYARWHDWQGGLTFATRMLCEGYPLLVPLLMVGWGRVRHLPGAAAILALLVAGSVFYQAVGVATFDRVTLLNPPHHPWRPADHFYLVGLRTFGLAETAGAVARTLVLFAATVLGAGWALSRVVLPEVRRPQGGE